MFDLIRASASCKSVMRMVHLRLGGGSVLGKTTLQPLPKIPTPHPGSSALTGFGPVNKPFKAFTPDSSVSVGIRQHACLRNCKNASTPASQICLAMPSSISSSNSIYTSCSEVPGSGSLLVVTLMSASSWLTVIQTGITCPASSSSETTVVARITRILSTEYVSVLIHMADLAFCLQWLYLSCRNVDRRLCNTHPRSPL